MNEIKKCSIAGVSFTFEQDAYQILNDYIESLQRSYEGDPDGEEIIAEKIIVGIANLNSIFLMLCLYSFK